jgi:hypothetical protein
MDIRPIDDSNYNPSQRPVEKEDSEDEGNFDTAPQQPMFMAPHHLYPPIEKRDLFSEMDKTTYIIIFVAFILGFFMGKTMQPVILKPM